MTALRLELCKLPAWLKRSRVKHGKTGAHYSQTVAQDLFNTLRDKVPTPCDFGYLPLDGGSGDHWYALRFKYARGKARSKSSIGASAPVDSFDTTHCNEDRVMSKIKTEAFKVAIGSPTNQERTYLTGEGVYVGDNRSCLVHALPIYRQKDYPNYQVRKTGPYVITMVNSGLRISATSEKMVFEKMEDAVKCAEEIMSLFALYGIPLMSEDPRVLLEEAKKQKEHIYEPMKKLAEANGAVFIEPQK